MTYTHAFLNGEQVKSNGILYSAAENKLYGEKNTFQKDGSMLIQIVPCTRIEKVKEEADETTQNVEETTSVTQPTVAQPTPAPVVAPVVAPAPVALPSTTTETMSKKDYLALKDQPLFVVMNHFGYKADKATRKELAARYNIKDYVGTKDQNIQLKAELLKQISVQTVAPVVAPVPVAAPAPVATPVSEVLDNNSYSMKKKDFEAFKQQPLFVVAQHFGFDFKKEKKNLAVYFGIKNYIGSYEQNVAIKQALLKLITVN